AVFPETKRFEKDNGEITSFWDMSNQAFLIMCGNPRNSAARPEKNSMKKLLSWPTLALTLLAPAFISSAQVGTGWSPITYTENLQYESNDIGHAISPPPTHFTDGYFTFDRTNGVDHF